MTDRTRPDAAADRTRPAALARLLRREILTGVLAPGSAIKERDQADRLGVSRTPLREAVRILAQEGLVTLRPLRSPLVADPDLTEVLDEIAVLRRLELFSGELACRNATPAEIAAIADLVAAVARDHAAGDALDVFDLDMRMHRAIVAAGHNAALTRTHAEYLSRLFRVRFLSARERADAGRVLADHDAMLHALQTRDAAAMERAIESHFDGLERNIVRQLRPADAATASAATPVTPDRPAPRGGGSPAG
ncbi:GntR family transcriptional regulator [Paracoccus luteus]|uniref:GntR family transcriptional regulator n=1 Tax=Paracoccus luteus TaxID=2508543 RepID=UPI00106FBDAD|nr:GntR family transcriptional regulator [Paracoccus luteus]